MASPLTGLAVLPLPLTVHGLVLTPGENGRERICDIMIAITNLHTGHYKIATVYIIIITYVIMTSVIITYVIMPSVIMTYVIMTSVIITIEH